MDRGARMRRLKGLVLLAAVLAAAGGGIWWSLTRHLVTTDNAYVKADSAQISSRVPGTVVRVAVENDIPVQVGQILVELDPTDFQIAREKARATLAENEAEVQGAEVRMAQTDTQTAAQVQAAEAALKGAQEREREVRHRLSELENRQSAASADLQQVQRDSERYEHLYRQGAGTQRQQDVARTELKKAKAQAGAIGAQLAATRASLGAIVQEINRARAQLQAVQSERRNVEVERLKLEALKGRRDRSRAERDAAEQNLAYCTLTAPLDGVVAQKSVQVGNRIQPGQPLMAVAPLREVYVEANFKETELTDVRLGQPAEIKADIYPGFTYRGRVVGIRAGTGATFSLLPAENATGNWIKVVQRIPVRIQLEQPPPPDHPLRLGFSLEVTIDTSKAGER